MLFSNNCEIIIGACCTIQRLFQKRNTRTNRRFAYIVASVALSASAFLSWTVPTTAVATAQAVKKQTGPRPLSNGLIGYQNGSGIGVIDPITGQHRILLRVPANSLPLDVSHPGQQSRPFRVEGPVWGPSPGSRLPSLYFSLYDDRKWETDSLAHYSWLFRANPFTGSLQPLAVRVAITDDGPESLVAYRGGIAFGLGCCQRLGIVTLPLDRTGQPHSPRSLFLPNRMLFPLGGSLGGRVVALLYRLGNTPHQQGTTRVVWLDPRKERLSRFALPAGIKSNHVHVVAFTPDGKKMALAIGPGQIAIFVHTPHPTLRLVHIPFQSVPSNLAWAPNGQELAVRNVAGRIFVLRLMSHVTTMQTLLLHSTGSISWSSELPMTDLHDLHTLPSPIPFVDGLLHVTHLPHHVYGYVHHPGAAVAVHLYPFDPHTPAAIRSKIASATRPLSEAYPSLPTLTDDYYWAPRTWLLGGAHHYRVIITGYSHTIAFTVELNTIQ
jgi:hypothetical protein